MGKSHINTICLKIYYTLLLKVHANGGNFLKERTFPLTAHFFHHCYDSSAKTGFARELYLYINEVFQSIKKRDHCEKKWTLEWVYISLFIDPKSHPQCNDLCLIIVELCSLLNLMCIIIYWSIYCNHKHNKHQQQNKFLTAFPKEPFTFFPQTQKKHLPISTNLSKHRSCQQRTLAANFAGSFLVPQLQWVIDLHRLPREMRSFLAHPCVLSTIQLTVDPDQQRYPAVNIIGNPTEHLLIRFPCFLLHSKYSHCLFIESKIEAREGHCDHLTSNQKLFHFFNLFPHLPTLDVDAECSLQWPI